MQTSRLRPLYQLTGFNNIAVRTVATNTAAATETQQLKSWREIPGPSRLPIIGQAHHFMPGGDLFYVDAPTLGNTLYKKFGPIVRLDGVLGLPPFIVLFDPEQSAQILRSENWLPIRPGFQSLDYYRRNKKTKTASGTNVYGLITDHGDSWKQFRSTVNPVLLQPKTIKLYSSMIDKVGQDMITRLKSLRGDNNMIQSDFQMEMNLWSLESIALIALGRRLNCFDSYLPPDSPEKRLIRIVHDVFQTADQLDFKPSLWRYYPTKAFKRAMKLYEDQETIARYFIDKTIEELNKQNGKKPEEQKSVLEKLLDINKDVAVVMASDLLFAGVDTTSNTITATLYLLANNQDKQNKLREEIRSISDLNEKRPYLKACLKESMRMMPVVSGNLRETTKEYNLLGYRIPEGMQISIMHQAMSVMELNYSRATEYLPERWLVDKEDPLYHKNTHPFVNQPFGFGVRSCIGRRIAELELETFLARLIENFKVEWFGPPMKTKLASINYITGPYNFIFKDAK